MIQLDSCINYLLSTAQNAVFQFISGRLAPFDITPSQYGVMNVLWSRDGACSPKQLSDALSLEISTISGILNKMQGKGLIERSTNAEDRREVLVTLTPWGRSLKDAITKVVEDVNEAVLGGFEQEDVDTLRRMLTEIGKTKYTGQ